MLPRDVDLNLSNASFIRRTLAATLCALVASCALAAGAGASVEERLDTTRERLDKAGEKKGVLTSDIEELSSEMRVLEEEIAVLRNREAAVEAELAAKQAELDQATEQLKVAVTELKELRHRLEISLVELRKRLVAIYRAGSPDIVSVILSSEGYDDLVQRAEYLSLIQTQDENVANRVRDLRDETKDLVGRLKDARERIEKARDAIAAKERELERTRGTIEAQHSSLESVRGERQAVLDQVESQMQGLSEIEASLQQRIQEQISAASGVSTPSTLAPGPVTEPSAAGLIWPADGLFTSPFGMRWGRMHEGIDISLSEGTPLRAAASGTVIMAAYTGGYGNYTCIDHGGGLSTCYAHQSSYAVSSGSSVSQGDIIGYSGNTGNSTGPHLHFEVRINGIAQDPMGYL